MKYFFYLKIENTSHYIVTFRKKEHSAFLFDIEIHVKKNYQPV